MISFISAFVFQGQKCTEICGIDKIQVCHIIFTWLAVIKVIHFFKENLNSAAKINC